MQVDNFLAQYNRGSNLLEKVAKQGSQDAVKNYSKSEFDDVLSSFNSIKDQQDQEAFDKALKEQTDAFEAFLVKTVLDISMKNKASIFEKDASDDIYSSMYNDTMSKALSGGMGFSQLLYNFLKENS